MNETRNIILYVNNIKKELEKNNIKNNYINFCIKEIKERIKTELESQKKDLNYELEKINKNIELLDIIEK